MKLKKLKINSYKSIRNIEVDIENDISLIVGKNNIGKSNVLKALKLFFDNLVSSETIVNKEDFRANTASIRIQLTFNEISNYLIKLKKSGTDEFLKSKPNQMILKEIEYNYQIFSLLKGNRDEFTIELNINRNSFLKSYKFIGDRKEKEKFVKYQYITKVVPQKLFKDFWDKDNVFCYDEFKIENNDIKIRTSSFIDINPPYNSQFESFDINTLIQPVLNAIYNTQKFLYIPSYRGGIKERENTINKLFDIIIEEIITQPHTANEYDIFMNAIWGTGRKGEKEKSLDGILQKRMTPLTEALKSETISNISDISFRKLDKLEVRRQIFRALIGTSNLILNDGIDTSFESKGTGIQSSFMISLMKALTSIEFNNSLNIILVIEEPEAFAHPQLTREILTKIIDSNIENHYQFLLTSHSPVVIDFVKPKKIQRIYEVEKGKTKETRNSVKDSELTLADEDWSVIDRILDLSMSEIVFADLVIFVEGEADKLVFSKLFKILIPHLVHRISIVSIGGCEQIFRFQKLLRYYKIPWLFIVDKDTIVMKSEKSIKVTTRNYKEILGSTLQVSEEVQLNWKKVLEYPMTNNITIKIPVTENLKYGRLLAKVNEISKVNFSDAEQHKLFKIITKNIDNEINSTNLELENTLKINNEFIKNEIPLFTLEADLEHFIINEKTYGVTLDIFKENWEGAYNSYIEETEGSDSIEYKLKVLRKKFGSKTFQLETAPNSSSDRKKPHIPILILNKFLEEIESHNYVEGILEAFPLLKELIRTIEKNSFDFHIKI